MIASAIDTACNLLLLWTLVLLGYYTFGSLELSRIIEVKGFILTVCAFAYIKKIKLKICI